MPEQLAPPLDLGVIHRRWTRLVRVNNDHQPLPEMFSSPDDREAAREVAAIADDTLVSSTRLSTSQRPPPRQSGAAVRMAPFAALGQPSRFSDGSYGMLYAGLDRETAIAETVFHSERHLRATHEAPFEFDMQGYVGVVDKPLEDLRGADFGHLRQPSLETWPICQAYGRERRHAAAWGFLYPSARRQGGECVGVFRPNAVSIPSRDTLYRYCWNGATVHRVLTISEVRDFSPVYRVA
ncbi:MAG: RES family NAD+ phosphorylase [Gammaproteobacteria bacterium]|nr:RES family NAD+ phosphorylase [Gammaproteobacteria bacterium]